MKTTFRVILGLAICFLCYICVMSVVTPINFENTRAERETAVVKNLVAIRTAEAEFRLQKGYFTANLDSLVLFLRTGEKKEVVKEGALTDKQLEAGLTEKKAVELIKKAEKSGKAADWKALEENGLVRNGKLVFKRDTISGPVLPALFKDEYTEETIGNIIYIPYTNGVKFEAEVNNEYATSQGIRVPLIEVRAHYNTYMGDQDEQERVNLIDKEEKLGHYAGLKFGDLFGPNNNAGNWE